MKLYLFIISVLIVSSAKVSFCQDLDNYVITRADDTLFFKSIKVSYYKRAVCTDSEDKKKRFHARKLKKVFTNGSTYESGGIVPLVIGWKKCMLLYRHPDYVENQTIVLYSYSGRSGSGDFSVTTTAIRNKDDECGDFGKMSINVRNKMLKACPDCTPKCEDMILHAPIIRSGDVFEIIRMVNEECSK